MRGDKAAFLINGRLIVGECLVSRDEIETVFGFGTSQSKARKHLNYLPPYVDFMVRAVAALGLTADQRVPKVTIEKWIRDNWRSELGQVSDKKVSSMVTFLRRPEDGKGGNLKFAPQTAAENDTL
jgi:hypothetical protein